MSTFPFYSRFRPFGFALSSAVVVFLTSPAPTQAQAPTFNVAEYAEYNENIDAAAASFAADVARRSGAAPVQNVERPASAPRNRQNTSSLPNTPNLTSSSSAAAIPSQRRRDVPKSQTARIWEAFLFGTPNRPVSKPKFAFAQRDSASLSEARAPRVLSSSHARSTQSPSIAQTSRTAQPAPIPQNAQNAQSVQNAADAQAFQAALPTTDEERAEARRRRLQELNALLASRRPEEFSRRLALSRAFSPQELAPVDEAEFEIDERLADDAPAFPTFSAEPTDAQSATVSRRRVEGSRESDSASFDVARANRPKIRQASNLEPAESLELADDGLAAFVLPIRPNALRLSPNVYLSTDLVRLPNAAPLLEATESAQTAQPLQNAQTTANAQTAQPLQSAQTTANAQTAQPLQNAQTTANAQTAQPLQNAQTIANAQTAQPLQNAQTTAVVAPSTDVPTLRPTAQFVEPRFLPTRR